MDDIYFVSSQHNQTREVTIMLLHEKITIIRKMNNLTQEGFAEELGVSRQAVSKWENGTSIPDVQLLLRIADFYNLTLDQLVRDDFDLPMSNLDEKKMADDTLSKAGVDAVDYLGKICDVSMNSFRHSVIRNIKIVGSYKNLICFEKNGRYGFFNKNKSLGILIKREETYVAQDDMICGKCTVYVNKGTYFGGNTYAFSEIVSYTEDAIEIHTGKFVTKESFDDVSVILMSDKINQ